MEKIKNLKMLLMKCLGSKSLISLLLLVFMAFSSIVVHAQAQLVDVTVRLRSASWSGDCDDGFVGENGNQDIYYRYNIGYNGANFIGRQLSTLLNGGGPNGNCSYGWPLNQGPELFSIVAQCVSTINFTQMDSWEEDGPLTCNTDGEPNFGGGSICSNDEFYGVAGNTNYSIASLGLNSTRTINYSNNLSVTYDIAINPYLSAPAVNDPSPVICAGTTILLEVASGLTLPGDQFRWYSDAGLTTVIGTGATYTASVGTYYVAEWTGTCNGPATQVVVTNGIVAAGVPITGDTVCMGETATITVDNSAGPSRQVSLYADPFGGTLLAGPSTGSTVVFTTPPIDGNTVFYVTVAGVVNACGGNAQPVYVGMHPKPTSPQIELRSRDICISDNFPFNFRALDEQIGDILVLDINRPDGTSEHYEFAITDTIWQSGFNGLTVGTNILTAYVRDAVTRCLSDPTIVSYDVATVPNAPTAEGTSICSGQSAYLTATGEPNANFVWYADAALTQLLQVGGNFTTPALTTNTSYWVTQADSGCASPATQVDVAVNSLPAAPNISGDGAICDGETVELTDLNNDGTYQTWWAYNVGEFSTGVSPFAGPTFNTQPLVQFTTIYAITVDPNTGCKSAVSFHDIEVNPKPTPPQVEIVDGCNGVFTNFRVNDEQIGFIMHRMYTLADGSVFNFSSTITDTVFNWSYGWSVPGQAYLTVRIEDPVTGCISDPTIQTFNIITIPSPPTAEGTSICSGQSAYLTATGEPNASFTWYADAALTQQLQVGGNFTTPALTANASYWVTQADSGCASPATQVDVAVTNDNEALVLTATPDTLCSNVGSSLTQATLSGGNASTVWYIDGGAVRIGTGASIVVNPGITTYYYAQDTLGACPSGFSVVKVNVKPPILPPSVNNLTFCETEDIILSATPVRNLYGGTTDPVYHGYPSKGNVLFINGTGTPIISNEVAYDYTIGSTMPVIYNIGTLPAGDYTYNVSVNDGAGCYSPYATFSVTVVEQLEKPMVEPVTICEGEDATLIATGCDGEVKWYADAALSNLLFVGSEFTKSGLTAGTHNFYATCNSSGACSSDDTVVTVTVNPAPVLPYGMADYTICFGQTIPDGEGLMATCPGGTDAVTGSSTITGTGTLPFEIGNDEPDGTVTFDASGLPAGAKVTGITLTLGLEHVFAGDVEIDLSAPSSTTVAVHDGNGGNDNFLSINTYIFSDAGASSIAFTTGDLDIPSGTYLPAESFATFNNLNAQGTWTLAVGDNWPGLDYGQFNNASITIDWIIPATGGDISWWDAPVGGTQLGDEFTFVPDGYETFAPGEYTYYVQCGDATECGNGRTPVTLTVLPELQAPTVTGDDPICEGTQATLTATGAIGTVEWYADADLTIYLGSGTTFTTPALSANTTYYAVNNNGVCLSTSTSYEVEVIPAPEFDALFTDNLINFYGELEICEGEPVVIYPFTEDPVNQVTLLFDTKEVENPLADYLEFAFDGDPIEINTFSDRRYYLRVYDFATGCLGDPFEVFIHVFNRHEKPEVRGAEVCVGETATIFADFTNFVNDFVPENGATEIWWRNADGSFIEDHVVGVDVTNDSLVVGPFAAPGTYSYLVSTIVYHENNDIFYCESYPAVVTVVVTDVPETPANLYDTICAGESTSFNTGDLGGEVRWYSDAALTDLITVSNTLNTGVLTATTQYWYTVSSNAGCASLAGMAEVFVNPLPTLTSVTNNTPICEHSDLELYANTDDATNLTFNWWTTFNGFTSTLQNPVIVDATEVNDEGFYFVTVTNTVTECTSKIYSTLAVITKFPDNIIADNDGPTCEDGTIQLNATNVFGATYAWTGPNGYTATIRNPIITDVTPDMSGTYTVVVTLGACSSEPASTEVVVYPNPVSYAGEDVSTLQGVPIILNGSGGTTYQWLPLSNDIFTLNPSNIPNPTFYSDSVGIYELYLTVWDDDHGCSDVDTVLVTVLPNYNLEVPDLITPNGDGVNDAFVIKYLENLTQSYTLSIYARAGAKVFETTSYGQDWRGTYKDDQLPDGAYWWVLALEDGTVYKGQLTIKR